MTLIKFRKYISKKNPLKMLEQNALKKDIRGKTFMNPFFTDFCKCQ